MHFKLPITAISSVTNRATGLGLTVGFAGASAIALTGDLPGTIDFMKETYPFLIPPAKFIVAFPLVYHTLGGLRHIVRSFFTITFSILQIFCLRLTCV